MLNKRYVSTLMIIAIALVAAIGLSVFSVSAQGPGNGTPMPCDGTGMMNGNGMGMMNRGGHHSMGHHGNMAGMMNPEDCPMYGTTQTSGNWWGWMEHIQLHMHNPETCPYYQAMTADE